MKSIEIGYQHPVIKSYLAVKKGKHRNLMAVEGIWAYEKLLETNTKIIDLIYCESLLRNPVQEQIFKQLKQRSANCYKVSEKTMKRLYEKYHLGGLVMTCMKECKIQVFEKILVLDGLENPGNIGTILRTCDGAGFDAVFIVNEKTCISQYKVVKASMGGAFSIPWFHFDSVKDCMAWFHEHDHTIYLAHPTTSSTKFIQGRLALVVGNERFGLSKAWFQPKSKVISIPMTGCCDSLNVGVAASILIYKAIGSA